MVQHYLDIAPYIHMVLLRTGLTCVEEEPYTGSRDQNATSEESAGRMARTSTAGERLKHSYTVEPVQDGHPWDLINWLFYRGGLLIQFIS